MSWTDRGAINHIKQIRDLFGVEKFIETGTFKGINAELHSKNFDIVFTCEKVKEFYYAARKRLDKYKNVLIMNKNSKEFLRYFNDNYYKMFYLDAHFYDPKAKQKWVVIDELKALKGHKNAIIVIHDFDNGLGHINYEGQSLNLKFIKKYLLKVNPKFHFYTNNIDSCDIVKPTRKDIKAAGLKYDKETIDNLKYAQTSPRLTYRGLLYCLPMKVNIEGLREWN